MWNVKYGYCKKSKPDRGNIGLHRVQRTHLHDPEKPEEYPGAPGTDEVLSALPEAPEASRDQVMIDER
jgi:hypothetical protein